MSRKTLKKEFREKRVKSEAACFSIPYTVLFPENEIEFQENEIEFQENETELQENEIGFQGIESQFQGNEIEFQEDEIEMRRIEMKSEKRFLNRFSEMSAIYLDRYICSIYN